MTCDAMTSEGDIRKRVSIPTLVLRPTRSNNPSPFPPFPAKVRHAHLVTSEGGRREISIFNPTAEERPALRPPPLLKLLLMKTSFDRARRFN